MRKILSSAVLVLALCVPPALAANPRNEAKAQVEFGIEVAQNGLWKEAMYRWERAVEIDPDLRCRLQQSGGGLRARGAVREGAQGLRHGDLELDPKNASIRQNYEFFKEINDRASRRNTR